MTTTQTIKQIIESNNLTNISFDHERNFVIYLNYKDNEPNNFIKLKTFYNEGGKRYRNGNPNDRSIGYNVLYVQIKICDEYISEQFCKQVWRSFDLTIEKLVRRNNKKFEALLTDEESLTKVLTSINKRVL